MAFPVLGPINNIVTGIRDQSLPFMFEVMDTASGLPKKQYILPLNPESYRKSESPRVNATLTQGSVFEDNIGLGLTRISVQGTFGYLGTLPGGHGKNLSGDKRDGWYHFKEIEETVLDFYRDFGTPGKIDIKKPPEIRFYNYCDKDYYRVQINRFDLMRNIARRFLYQYDIQMTVLDRLDKPHMSEDALVTKLKELWEPKTEELSLWEEILKGYETVYAFMSDVINFVNDLKMTLNTIAAAIAAFRQGITDFIEAPFGLVDAAINTVDSITASITSIADIPHEFTALLRDTKRNLMSLKLHQDKFRVTAGITGTTATTGLEIMTAPLPTGQVADSVVTMNTPESTLFAEGSEIVREVAALQVPVNLQDSIESIAYRTLGDAREWKRIAILNGLEYPFIVADFMSGYSPALATGTLVEPALTRTVWINGITPQVGNILVFASDDRLEAGTVESVSGEFVTLENLLSYQFPAGTTVTSHERALAVLKPGDHIGIPGDAGSGKAVIDGGTDFANRVFGTDEELDDDGNMISDGAGDIAVISGTDNLLMQLRHRLMTVKGELAALGHPQYGSYLPLIVGRAGTPVWYERARVEAIITLLDDPRISNVENATLEVDGTAVYFEGDVRTVGQTDGKRMRILVN